MDKKFDVVVIGGGTAGVIAAIQAGRANARTLLVEKNVTLGGTITNAGVAFPGLFHAWTKQIVKGIGWELVKKCVDECDLSLPDFKKQKRTNHWQQQIKINPFIFSALCDEAIVEAGVTPLFHTMVADINNKKNYKEIQLCTKTGLKTVKSKIIIDCTGDANVVNIAGYKVLKSENCQPATLCCHASGYDLDEINIESLQKEFEKEVEQGNLKYTDIGWNKNSFTLHWLKTSGNNANHIYGNNMETSQGKTSLSIEGRKSLLRLFRFLKKQPGLENLSIDYVAPECGVRETTRIKGKKKITVDDYISGKLWEDAVCYSFYPIDLHTREKDGLDKRYLEKGVVPSIPRRAMLPLNSKNIIVAGRCISSDRLANSALRTQASCMAMGQAAGAMGALSAKTESEVSNLTMDSIYSLLEKHDAIIPGTN